MPCYVLMAKHMYTNHIDHIQSVQTTRSFVCTYVCRGGGVSAREEGYVCRGGVCQGGGGGRPYTPPPWTGGNNAFQQDAYRWGGGVCPTPLDADPHPVNRMTHAGENITVTQTSFAGGNHGHWNEERGKKTFMGIPTLKCKHTNLQQALLVLCFHSMESVTIKVVAVISIRLPKHSELNVELSTLKSTVSQLWSKLLLNIFSFIFWVGSFGEMGFTISERRVTKKIIQSNRRQAFTVYSSRQELNLSVHHD